MFMLLMMGTDDAMTHTVRLLVSLYCARYRCTVLWHALSGRCWHIPTAWCTGVLMYRVVMITLVLQVGVRAGLPVGVSGGV